MAAPRSELEAEGWLDIQDLTLTLQFSSHDMVRDLQLQRRGAALVSDRLRTWVHEQSHIAQVLGTSVGLYVWMIRSAQTRLTAMVMHRLSLRGETLGFPLRQHVRGLEERADAELHDLLLRWEVLDYTANEFFSSDRAFLSLGSQDSIGRIPWFGRFGRVQYELAQLWRPDETRELLARESMAPVTGGDLPDQEAMAIALTMASRAVMVTGVMESAALAAEYLPDDVDGLAEAVAMSDPALIDYSFLLSRTRPKEGSRSGTWIATHLALCDAALNPPCLPIHVSLRTSGELAELHPALRAMTLLQQLPNVEPATSLRDCLRCSDDLCRAAGWATVSEVVRLGRTPGPAELVRTGPYSAGCSLRMAYPPCLFDPEVALYGRGLGPDRYRAAFSPSLTRFEDRTTLHPDANLGLSLIVDAVLHQWHRQLMVGRPQALDYPVGVEEDVLREALRDLVHDAEAMVGCRPPPPVFRRPEGVLGRP